MRALHRLCRFVRLRHKLAFAVLRERDKQRDQIHQIRRRGGGLGYNGGWFTCGAVLVGIMRAVQVAPSRACVGIMLQPLWVLMSEVMKRTRGSQKEVGEAESTGGVGQLSRSHTLRRRFSEWLPMRHGGSGERKGFQGEVGFRCGMLPERR